MERYPTAQHRPPRRPAGPPRANRRPAPPARPARSNPPRRSPRSGRPPLRSSPAINRSVSVVAGIFFIFVLIYLIRSLYTVVMSPHTATEVVQTGSIDVPSIISGVIVRSEQVYYAERAGRVMFNISEYERVKPGAYICSIQNVAEVEEINRDIATIEETLNQLQETRQDISNADPAIQRINAQIKNIVDGQLPHFAAMEVSEVYALKDSLTQRIDNRNQMIFNENLDIKDDLNSQQQMLMSQLGEHASGVYARQGGVLVPLVDELEESLTFDTMQNLNREQTLQFVDYDQLNPPKDVETGVPIFKIVVSNEWYIASYIPSAMINGWEEGNTITIYLENGDEYRPLSVTLAQINPGHVESYVLFKCTKNILDFMDMRSVRFKTADSELKGLKISAAALAPRVYYVVPPAYIHANEDKTQYFVTKQTAEGNIAFPVTVTDQNAEYAYIAQQTGQLSAGDILVAAGDPAAAPYTVSETVTGQGVYRVNNGVAEYRRVQLDTGDTAAGGYVILNPAFNQGIMAYDYIVTDASGITEGQIIQ